MEDGEGSTATVFMTNDIYNFINEKFADFEFKVGEYITLSYDWELTGTPSSNTTYPTMIRAEISDTPYRYGTPINSVGTNSPTTHVKTITANEKSGHICTIYKIDSDSSVSNAKKVRFRIDNLLSNYYVTISNLKLEKGNKPTDWSPAPEDTLSQTSEVIVGTQTATTAAWTGVASFSSLEDNQQITYWLPQTSANNATLNLTLAGGGTTGAKPLYYGGTSRLGTHYPAGSVIHLTYRKNVTIGSTTIAEGWWADANYNTNDNTYDRIRLNNNIKAKSAITNSRLIVGDSGGYFHLAAGSSFDIDKPILWAGSDIAANGSGSNNYLSMPSCTIRNNTNSSWTATQNLTLYLVGVLSGNKFIVDSTTPFTTNLPTAENNQYYISLGYMISSYQIYLYPEHPIFKYSNGQFRNISQIAYEAFTSEIGGKNIIRRSREFDSKNVSSEETGRLTGASEKATFGAYKTFVTRKIVNSVASDVVAQYRILNVELNEQYAVSFYARGTGQARVYFYGPSNYIQVKSITAMTNANGKIEVNGNPGGDGNVNITLSNTWKRYWIIYTLKGTYTNNTEVHEKDLLFRCDNKPTEWEICGIKLEKGNKVTDWSPAPEDNDKLISDTASVADQAAQNAGTAISKVDSLERQIQNIVVDDNKLVSVTQDGNGIKIDMTAATNEINQLLKDIDKKATGQNLEDLKKELEKQISALSGRTAYINASTDSQGRPVITLGATDSPFKVQITNEAINFIQNGQIIAYANGQKFYNLRTVVQQDVQIGNGPGFIWRTRDSGNMGLTWVSG